MFYQGADNTDVFDWIEVIESMKGEGYTQKDIADRVDWSREGVKNYQKLIDSLGTEIIESAKRHQKGRVPIDGTNVPKHNFTEGWFRNSGIYNLNEKHQKQLIGWFIGDKCNWNSNKVTIRAHARWNF